MKKVICIDAEKSGGLITENKEYEVIASDEMKDCFKITDDYGRKINVATWRFKDADIPKDIEKEKNLLKLSGKLWNEFISLPVEHQSELKEMEFFIHGIQGIISIRIARKQNPKIFPFKR